MIVELTSKKNEYDEYCLDLDAKRILLENIHELLPSLNLRVMNLSGLGLNAIERKELLNECNYEVDLDENYISLRSLKRARNMLLENDKYGYFNDENCDIMVTSMEFYYNNIQVFPSRKKYYDSLLLEIRNMLEKISPASGEEFSNREYEKRCGSYRPDILTKKIDLMYLNSAICLDSEFIGYLSSDPSILNPYVEIQDEFYDRFLIFSLNNFLSERPNLYDNPIVKSRITKYLSNLVTKCMNSKTYDGSNDFIIHSGNEIIKKINKKR